MYSEVCIILDREPMHQNVLNLNGKFFEICINGTPMMRFNYLQTCYSCFQDAQHEKHLAFMHFLGILLP